MYEARIADRETRGDVMMIKRHLQDFLCLKSTRIGKKIRPISWKISPQRAGRPRQEMYQLFGKIQGSIRSRLWSVRTPDVCPISADKRLLS